MERDEFPSEPDWVRSRIERLRDLRGSAPDDRARRAIDELIAEAEERLRRIAAR
jgi:hypothetical protein